MKKYQQVGSVFVFFLGSIGAANAIVIPPDNSGLPFESAIALSDGMWAEGAFSTATLCPAGCSLDKISLRMHVTLAASNPVNVSLTVWSSQGTSNIGSLAHTGGNSFPVSLANGLSEFTASAPINLAANSTYWVRLTNLDTDKDIEWAYDTTPGSSFTFFDPTEAPGSQLATVADSSLKMKIEATPRAVEPVPLPASVWLMGTALLGLMNTWRRKRG